jgi:hypothetical protein
MLTLQWGLENFLAQHQRLMGKYCWRVLSFRHSILIVEISSKITSFSYQTEYIKYCVFFFCFIIFEITYQLFLLFQQTDLVLCIHNTLFECDGDDALEMRRKSLDTIYNSRVYYLENILRADHSRLVTDSLVSPCRSSNGFL